jgi:hypothetical protein
MLQHLHLCRLCWAPDGSAVVGVNSFQSPKHTAVILQRGTWGQGDRVPDYLVSAWFLRHRIHVALPI